ncbi:MAG: hypothetical protein IPH83_19070 [Gammaproteobacteria bacterium]|nr:hypothetical protein [Gammaproteobacteria bacterium]
MQCVTWWRRRGCRVCKGTGWPEIMGCGMVHPRVLEIAGHRCRAFHRLRLSAWASSAPAMLRYGVTTCGCFMRNDLRFLGN